MAKIRINDTEYSNKTPNEDLSKVIASYNGFCRGLTLHNYPNFIGEIIRRTKFIDEAFPRKVIKQGTRFVLVEKEIWGYDDMPDCLICDENKVMPLNEGGLSECCSTSCAAKLSVMRSEPTNMKNRGVRHHAQDPSVREKTINTLRKVYPNATCPMSIPSVKEKAKRTNMKRRGVEHHMLDPILSSQVVENQKDNPNSIHHPLHHDSRRAKEQEQGYSKYIKNSDSWMLLNDKEQLSSLIDTMSLNDASVFLGVCRGTVSRYADLHGIEFDRYRFGNRSGSEIQVEKFIKSIYSGEVISGYRGFDQACEIDIYLPDMNLGIEYNGIYWHSINPQNVDKFDKNRHLIKTKKTNENGIRLIHIFEDEWINRRKQTEDKLKAILGVYEQVVYGRKTVASEVSAKEAKEFLEEYHIQGATAGFFYGGLYYDNSLVAVMSFSKTRAGVELSRFATSCKVHGGFSKLLKFFVCSNQDIDVIVSFADRRWSEGNVYESCGFQHVSDSYPDYRYVVGGDRVHKSNFRKDRMVKVLKNYDPTLTESENAWNHGLYRIYDCGLKKYVLDLS